MAPNLDGLWTAWMTRGLVVGGMAAAALLVVCSLAASCVAARAWRQRKAGRTARRVAQAAMRGAA